MGKKKNDTFRISKTLLESAVKRLKTNEDRGKLLTAIYEYQCGKPLFIDDRSVDLVFGFFIEEFERENDRERVVNEAKAAAKRRYWHDKQYGRNEEETHDIPSAPARRDITELDRDCEEAKDTSPREEAADTHIQGHDEHGKGSHAPADIKGKEGDAVNNAQEPVGVTYTDAEVGQIITMNGKRVVKRNGGVFIIPTLEEVKDYVKEKGYHFEPQAFLDYYENSNPHPWHMANGKPVKSWKQCCSTFENHVFLSEGRRAVSRQQRSFAHDNITSKEYEPF